MLNEREVNVI